MLSAHTSFTLHGLKVYDRTNPQLDTVWNIPSQMDAETHNELISICSTVYSWLDVIFCMHTISFLEC